MGYDWKLTQIIRLSEIAAAAGGGLTLQCRAVMQSLAVRGERREESTQNMPGVKKYSSTSSSLVLQSHPPLSLPAQISM